MIVRGLWGTQINPREKKQIASDASFKITMASIYKFSGSTRTSVYISFQNSTFLLCSLIPEKIEQQVIDLTCLQGESITFTSEGPNTIHLMGNYITQEGIDDDALDSEEQFLEIDNEGLLENELDQDRDQEDHYQDIREHENLHKQLERKDMLEQEDKQKNQHQHKYALRKRKQQDDYVYNGTEKDDEESSMEDNMNDKYISENEDILDGEDSEDQSDGENQHHESMLINNNDTIDPTQQSSSILVTKKNYIDFDESDSFESGTDSVIDELDLPRLQYVANKPVQSSEPTNHTKDNGKERTVEGVALGASNRVQNVQNMTIENESDPSRKVSEKQSETEPEEVLFKEPDSNSQDRRVDIKQYEPMNEPDRSTEANQDKPMNESDSSLQPSPLPVTTDKPVKKPIDDKKKAAKSKQPEVESSAHPEKHAFDQPNKKSKQSEKESSDQAAKRLNQTENDSTDKLLQKPKNQLKKERKRLAKQNLEAELKAKEEKKKAKKIRKALAKKKKKEEAASIHENSDNQVPQVIAVTPKLIKKKDKSKSIPEGKTIEETKPQSEPTKTEKIKKYKTSKEKTRERETLEDKPIAAEEASFIKKKPVMTLDPKSTDSSASEVSLNNVKSEARSSDSPSQERNPRYPRRAIGAESLEKLRMMAEADATVAKSISRERGRNKKRTRSMPPDTRSTKKRMPST